MKLILYVADEFKTLEGGKTLAVGLFTDRVVVLNVPHDVPSPSSEMPYGILLSLLACLIDMPKAEVTGSATIIPPSGVTSMNVGSVSSKAVVGGSANIVFRLDPFLMTGEGLYTLVLEFEGVEPISDTFELRVKKTDDRAVKRDFIRLTEQPSAKQ